MRIALVILFCSVGLMASGRPAVLADDKADVEKELKKHQGTWTVESIEAGGKKLPADLFKGMTLTFEGDKYSVKMGAQVIQAATLKLDPSKSPKTMDATVTDGLHKGSVILGIYEINGDTLKECFDEDGKKRPTEFKTVAGTQTTLVVYRRVKK